jgi:TonB family protein
MIKFSPILLATLSVLLVARINAQPPQATAVEPAAAGAATLQPLIEVEPQYPAAALRGGIEGFVELTYTVSTAGQIENVQVTAAEPAGRFDQAAIAAMTRWRYPANESRSPTVLVQRFEFTLADSLFSLRSDMAQAAGSAGRVRNECLREQTSYNYGEMVEVGLINACAQPLLVFSCAEGRGREALLWVCQSLDRERSLLLPAGDGRTDSLTDVPTPDGLRPYRYTSALYLRRAPNSEYWWLACGLQDAACRETGEQWIDAVDRQAASLNPQNRTARQLARSY